MSLLLIPNKVLNHFPWEGNNSTHKFHLIKLERVTQPKCKGSLGVERFSLSLEVSSEMASGVQKAFKHGEKVIWSTKSSNAPYKIGPWKFITKLVAEFFQNIDFRPDNGAHARFWKDKWLNETILTVKFPSM